MLRSLLLPVLLLLTGCPTVAAVEDRRAEALTEAGVAERTLEHEGFRIHLREGGKGRPLLLLHGFAADATATWAPLAELADGWRLVAPDLLGFGSTGPRPVTLEAQADLALATLDALGLERVDAIGTSYGGFVLAELARRHPERLGRLIFVSSPGPAWTFEEFDRMGVRLGVEHLDQLLLPTTPAEWKRLVQHSFHRQPPLTKAVLAELTERAASADRTTRTEALDDLERRVRDGFGPPEDWRTPHERLILWGDGDGIFPPRMSRDTLSFWGEGAKLVPVPRAGHALTTERPDAVISAARPFLKDPTRVDPTIATP